MKNNIIFFIIISFLACHNSFSQDLLDLEDSPKGHNEDESSMLEDLPDWIKRTEYSC